MSDFVVRRARVEDAEAVVALRVKVFPYLVRGQAATTRQITEPAHGEDRVPFVAERAGAVVGWVSAGRDPRAADKSFGKINLLHVDPAHGSWGSAAHCSRRPPTTCGTSA